MAGRVCVGGAGGGGGSGSEIGRGRVGGEERERWGVEAMRGEGE